MREAIAALQSALATLELARDELPADLRSELVAIIEQARTVLATIRSKAASEPVEES